MSRAALLKLQAKSPPERPAAASGKIDAAKKKSKKKPASKR
jgi:hypothetical protein